MVYVHSKLIHRGPTKFLTLKAGMAVIHLTSDAGSPEEKRAELRRFVFDVGLPPMLLTNPHLTESRVPHLDVWGAPAKRAAEAVEKSMRKELEHG